MKVALIGPGRLGTLLAAALSRAGHRVTAVAGGKAAARERIAALVAGVRSVGTPEAAAELADLIVLSVNDGALEEVATDLAVSGVVGEGHRVVHLAGSRGLEPLRRVGLAGAGIAACHPAMTVPAGSIDPQRLVGVAWAVTASPADQGWAHRLVEDLGGDPQSVAEDARDLYHAGLAVGSNAVGAAVATARRLLIAARVARPEAFLAPLIEASVGNVLEQGATALTGPIARGDLGTIELHLAAIDRDVPELLPAYRALASATLAPLEPALPDDTVATFRRMFEQG